MPTIASELPRQPFDTEAREYRYLTAIAAKLAIADEIATPLAKLSPEDHAFIEGVLAETPTRSVVLSRAVDFLSAKILGSTEIRGALHP